MLIQDETPEPDALVERAWGVVEVLLKLTDSEKAFVDLLQAGELKPELLFPDRPEIAERMGKHPALLWKAENAAAHARRRRNP